jgi:Stability determinant
MNALSPLVSELETVEQAEAYHGWPKAEVAAAKADGWPTMAHDEAMKRVRAVIRA